MEKSEDGSLKTKKRKEKVKDIRNLIWEVLIFFCRLDFSTTQLKDYCLISSNVWLAVLSTFKLQCRAASHRKFPFSIPPSPSPNLVVSLDYKYHPPPPFF